MRTIARHVVPAALTLGLGLLLGGCGEQDSEGGSGLQSTAEATSSPKTAAIAVASWIGDGQGEPVCDIRLSGDVPPTLYPEDKDPETQEHYNNCVESMEGDPLDGHSDDDFADAAATPDDQIVLDEQNDDGTSVYVFLGDITVGVEQFEGGWYFVGLHDSDDADNEDIDS